MLGFSLSWLFSKHVAKNCTIFLSSWEGLGARGEGDDRGWDGWIASPTRWTWVSVNSGSWWWTGRPGVLWFMGLQRVGHEWATELNWKPLCIDETQVFGLSFIIFPFLYLFCVLYYNLLFYSRVSLNFILFGYLS